MIAQTPQLFSAKNYSNWLMNVEDIASQISVLFGIQHDWREQISGVHVSPGIAETLARGGGITSHHLVVHSQSATSLQIKLPKSVNVRWSYSVLQQYRFINSVYKHQIYKHVEWAIYLLYYFILLQCDAMLVCGIYRRRVSVCLSNSGTVSKWLNIGSRK